MHAKEEEPGMVKTGKVKVGITPSEISGRKSTMIKKGVAITSHETKKLKTENDITHLIDLD